MVELRAVGGGDAATWLFDILIDRRRTEAGDHGGTWQPLCSHAVLPTGARTRFLVPLDRSAAAGSVTAFNRLRPWGARAPRAAVGACARLGVLAPLLRSRTAVSWRSAGGDDLAATWLVEHLRRELGERELVVAAGLRRGDTFAKPVLQLFRPDGSPVGYAKVGWNEVTIPRVRNEAAVLASWPTGASGGVSVPRVLHAGGWAGRYVLVTAPLPRSARRLRRGDAPARASAALALGWPTSTGVLGGSAYWASLTADAARLAPLEVAGHGPLGDVLARVGEAMLDTELTFGRWHGDWVTWNLAVADGRLWAWDWEYSDASVPVGLDVLHHHFQELFVGRRRPTDVALRLAARRAAPMLAELGLSPEAVRATVLLHRAELLRRDAAAEALGGTPDPRLDREALGGAGT